MTQEQALNILVQAVNIGQSKGAYSLQEATIVAQAVAVFTKKEDKVEAEVKPESAPDIKED